MSLKYYIKKSESKDYTHDLTVLNIVITKSCSNTSEMDLIYQVEG